MNIENLIEGAAFLEQLELKPSELFDIGHFIERYKTDAEHTCGTAACALGWMAIHGMFGLMEWQDTVKLRYTQIAGFAAGREAFDITREQANWLFHGSHYRMSTHKVTKEMVAARMRWLAAGGAIDNFKEDRNAD